MGKQKSTQTTQETRNPWSPTVQPMTDLVGKITSAATPQAFTPTYSASTMNGIKALEDYAKGPHSTNTAITTANDYMTRGAPVGLDELITMARGDRVGNNPFLDELISNQSSDLASSINGMFSGSGRLGSGANQQLLASTLGKLNTETRMNDYNTERGYQVAAANALANGGMTYAGMTPSLESAAMAPSQALLQVGQMRDLMTQAQKQAPLSALDYQRQALLSLANAGGTSSGTNTTTQPSNTLGQIAGGAMMLGSMAAGMPPISGFNPSGFGFGMPS